ncbi:MAG: ABC transporter ATP-binding protein [Coriobacteriia bacterium]|nr:ABC transporter ATP-binding protein [Coriobacteriia bacterium]
MSAALELRDVWHSYVTGNVRTLAVRDVHLIVGRGEMVSLMGPSGSGKSTLLMLAAGLLKPDRGDVFVEGRQVDTADNDAVATLRRRSLGYVLQDRNLLPTLTAAENVSLPLELEGRSLREARSVAIGALEAAGVAGCADRFPDDLSGGEQQRVAVARAIAGDRALVLADEPTSALDSLTGEGVMRLLRDYCERGGTALYVTHDAANAAWADRVVFLRDGRICDQSRIGCVEELLVAGAT